MRLGLIGCGGIGSVIARAVASGDIPGVKVVAVVGSTVDSPRARAVGRLVEAPATSFSGLLEHEPDWVMEAAGVAAAVDYVPRLVAHGVGAIVLSVGAMLHSTLAASYEVQRALGRGKIVIPSGGIGALDAIASLNAFGGIQEVSITTTKRPEGLSGAPYLTANKIELSADTSMVIFEGPASRAIVGFPANVNVAVALSLAGVGADRTLVTIVSDPFAKGTRHEIRASGPAATVRFSVESVPHPQSPGTSVLAALSAAATIKGLARTDGAYA